MRGFFYWFGFTWLLSFSGYLAAQADATKDHLALNQDYAPLEKSPPVYPYVSQFNGIEGYCIVEYTVTATGTVEGAQQPMHRLPYCSFSFYRWITASYLL